MKNIIRILEQAAEQHGQNGILVQDGSLIPYREMEKAVRKTANRLRAAGVPAGGCAMISVSDSYRFFVTFWGMVCADIVPVVISYSKSFRSCRQYQESIENICKTVPSCYMVTDCTDDLPRDRFAGLIDCAVLEQMPADESIPDCTRGDDDTAVIFFSSGSTGVPKGVPLSHKCMMAQTEAIHEQLGLNENDRILNWLPCTHIFGFAYQHLAALRSGAVQAHLTTEQFIGAPQAYLRMIAERQITCTAGMNFSFDLLSDVMEHESDAYSLASLRHFLFCGEPVSASVIKRFLGIAAQSGFRSEAFRAAYGMTETGCVLSLDTDGFSEGVSTDGILAVSLGTVYDGLDVRIADDSGKAVPDGTQGEILVRGGAVFCGYYAAEDEDAFTPDGYFRTGDIGFTSGGKLYVSGRKKDIIIVNGINYYPADFEAAVERECGIRTLLTQRTDGAVVLYFRRDQAESDARKTAGRILQTVLSYSALEISIFVPVESLRITERGKIDRRYYRDLAEKTETVPEAIGRQMLAAYCNDSSAADTDPVIAAEVCAICSGILGIQAAPDDQFYLLGGSSVKVMQLAEQLSARYGVSVSMYALINAPDIRSIAAMVSGSNVATDTECEAILPDKAAWYQPFPLTDIQISYVFGRNQMYDGGGIPTRIFFEYRTTLDIKRLEDAVNRVIRDQKVLRTVFSADGTQRVLENCPRFEITVCDVRHLSEAEQHRILHEKKTEIAAGDCKLDVWPLFAMEAVMTSSDGCHLLLGIDLMILDAYHVLAFQDAVIQYYRDPQLGGTEPEFSFRDYVMELNRRKQSDKYESDKAYWMAMAEDFPAAPQLLFQMPPAEMGKPVFVRKSLTLSSDEYNTLRRYAEENRVSVSALFSTAYAYVLSRYSNQKQIALNYTVFDRYAFSPEITKVMGDYTSTILVPFTFDGETVQQAVQNTQQAVIAGLDHRMFSGVEFCRELRILKNTGNSAIMPYVFTSTVGLGVAVPQELGEPVSGISQTAQVFIDCQLWKQSGGLTVNWDYVSQLFAPSVIDEMFALFSRCIRSLPLLRSFAEAADPDGALADFVAAYNRTAQDIPTALLQEAFEKNAAEHGKRIAVSDTHGSFTYAELNRYAEQTAAKLQQAGVKPGSFVGVRAYRVKETIGNILGILKAGAAYVPVDPDNPASRQDDILTNSECVLCIEKDYGADGSAADYRRPEISTDQPAYVIYTSGSTGKPKGVVITHDAAWNTVCDINARYHVMPDDRIIGLSSMCFDLSVYDIFGSLSAGAQLCMVPDLHNVRQVAQIVLDNKVTVWNSVPAVMQMYVEQIEQDAPESCVWSCDAPPVRVHENPLRLVIMSGDWIPMNLPDRISRVIPGAEIISMGGATEASIWSIYYPITHIQREWNSIPYGRPLANQSFYVLSYDGALCPTDVRGELCIGGRGVALGYHNNPEKTDAAFFVHPTFGRLYRTGDLGALRRDGNIEFMGRRDHQVKVGGHRIELGEIEHAFRAQQNVADVVITAKKSDKNIPVIYAYVVAAAGQIDVPELKNAVSTMIPKYMIPAHIILLDSIPLTSNGKIDRKALPEIAEESEIAAPRNAAEQAVSEIWCKVLGRTEISVHEDFYDAGGDSLKLIRIAADLEDCFHVHTSHVALLDAGTIAGQARYLESLAGTANAVSEKITVEPDPAHQYEPFALTQLQNAYLVGRDEMYEIGGIATHGYYEYDTALDLGRLERAVNKVIADQPMLRMYITADSRQCFARALDFHINITDAQHMTEQEQEEAVLRYREQYSHEVMDPAKPPLFRLAAVKTSPDHAVLIFSVDLLTMDAASVQLFKHLVLTAYDHPETPPSAVRFTFRDFVSGIAQIRSCSQYAEDEAYWAEKSYDFPPAPQLPLLKPISEVSQITCRRLGMTAAPAEWSALKSLAAAHSVSPSAVLVVLYAKVLSHFSNQPDCCINMTTFNRYSFHEDTDKIIGDFTSTMLLDLHFKTDEAFWQFVQDTQKHITENLEHRSFSGLDFMKLIRQNGKDCQRYIAPVVFTSTLSSRDAAYTKSFGTERYGISQTSQVYLDCQVAEECGALHITWDYVEQLLSPETAEAMFVMFERAVRSLCEQTTLRSVTAPDAAALKRICEYNSTAKDITKETLHGLFLRTARNFPQKPAVKDTEGSYTYAELETASAKAAAYLQKNGVKSGDFVGVLASRSRYTVANILGILRAGAAYVPVDPNNPRARRDDILANAGCKICMEGCIWEHENSAQFTSPMVEPDQTAYVIYTSGSTGKPKGVVITHDAASNTIQDINQRFHVTAQDNIIGLSSMCFDLSVYDLFGAFAAGSTLVMIPEIHDVRYIQETVRREEITVWNSVPAVMQMYLDVSDSSKPLEHPKKPLRLVMLSGDWIPLALPERINRCLPNAQLISLGGATEASIWSIYYPVKAVQPEWNSIPYGMPLANQSFYVLDYDGNPCADHVPGELMIGGRGVAECYHNDPEKTAASYFMHPLFGRLYRTGDFGRMQSEGYIEFLGRRDNQVKIRGHRIELGEIESAMLEQPAIRQACAVILRSDSGSYIAAAAVSDEAIDSSTLKAALSQRIPHYMIPSVIIQVTEMPLTVNGKIDRQRLEEMCRTEESAAEIAEAQTETEKTVESFWKEILELDTVGVNQDFYELDGDSIKLFTIIAKLEQTYGITIPREQVFSLLTITEMAELVETLTSCAE